MSEVRWYYERSVYEETSCLTFFFAGANAEAMATIRPRA